MVFSTFESYLKRDPSAFELGYHEHYKPYVLSSHPVRASVADRGLAITAFTRDRYRYHVYIGFSQRPIGRNPYNRFLIVKGECLDNKKNSEGVLLIEDPYGDSTHKNGRFPFWNLAKHSKNESTFTTAAKCYMVAWGIIDMMNRLKIFDGKDFKPFRKTLELLSVPIIGQILGSFLEDPKGGFDTTMANLVLPRVACREEALPLSEYFKISEVLKAYPNLRDSQSLMDRSKGFICHIVADPLLGGDTGALQRRKAGAEDFPLDPGEVNLLLVAVGAINHDEWLRELSVAELLLLAQRAWGEISIRIGVEDKLSVLQMADPGNENFQVMLRLPTIEVLSDAIVRLCHALGLG